MGSLIEINDTLQISKDQGFPAELDADKNFRNPYKLDDLKENVFRFTNKSGIRFYHQPPVRVFLVENVDGKWLYWGLCHILSITHDYIKKTTSGEFKIIYLNTPEEMKQAHQIIDQNPKTNYFS